MIDVEALRADLLDRLPSPSPADIATAGIVAELALLVERVAVRAHLEGWDESTAQLFCSVVDRLVRGLHALGTDRIAGCAAEGLSARAVALADALFDDLTPAGSV